MESLTLAVHKIISCPSIVQLAEQEETRLFEALTGLERLDHTKGKHTYTVVFYFVLFFLPQFFTCMHHI